MITLSRQKAIAGSGCQRCRIIRAFVVMALLLVVLGLVAGDRMAVLQRVTPERVAAAIMIGGSFMAFCKIGFWYWQKRRQDEETSAGPEQA